MNKEIQTRAKQTDIPEDMWEAVGALREALFDNPCVILDAEVCEDEDRHYFFSDDELYGAIQKVVENLPGPIFQGHSYVALAYALQKHGVICEAAVTDSTDYDGGKTLHGILRAFEDLNSPPAERQTPEVSETATLTLGENGKLVIDSCPEMFVGARSALEQMVNRHNELIEQLSDAREQRDRLVEALRTAFWMITRHHEAGVIQELGCFCPVCHRDGKEPEMDQIITALAAVEGGKS